MLSIYVKIKVMLSYNRSSLIRKRGCHLKSQFARSIIFMLLAREFLPEDAFYGKVGSMPAEIHHFNAGQGDCDV